MDYLISFILAFIISFFSTPFVRKMAVKTGAVCEPKDERRIHKKPVALMGGLAISTAFLFSIIYNMFSQDISDFSFKSLWGFLTGIILITITGILDDIFTLKAWQKFSLQIIAALPVVIFSDVLINQITNPLIPSGKVPLQINTYLSYALTILWIVGITNAVNFIDGLDGLAAGVCAISSLALFFVTILRDDIPAVMALYPGIITISLAGAALGFLPYNFYPAKIFMGETGAAFLGYSLAVISIQGNLKSYAAISIIVPLLVLGIPVFDTAFAIVRRIKNKKPVYEADREHIHHMLVDKGLSQKQTVLILYIVSIALGLCAVIFSAINLKSATIFLLLVSIFIALGLKYINEIHSPILEDDKDNENDVEIEKNDLLEGDIDEKN